MGGAQPLAVTMNGGVGARRRGRSASASSAASTRATSTASPTPRRGARLGGGGAARAGEPLSIALRGNAADVLPELVRRGVRPDVVTDQTSAHDPLNGYVPAGLTPSEAAALRARDPGAYLRARAANRWRGTCARCSSCQRGGAVVFDYGNNIRGEAEKAGVRTPSTIPASCPPTSGRSSARARARSAGSRSPAIPATSARPTAPCSRPSRTTSTSRAGSAWRGSACSSRACPRASAGSATASARRPAGSSTSSSQRGA